MASGETGLAQKHKHSYPDENEKPREKIAAHLVWPPYFEYVLSSMNLTEARHLTAICIHPEERNTHT